MPSQGDSFLRRVGPLLGAKGIGACVTFVIPLVLARMMSLEEYGTYKQLLLLALTLYYVLPFGVPQALYFFLPRTEERRPFILQTLVFLTLAGGLAGTLLFALAEPLARYFSNPSLVTYRWQLALYVFGLISACPLEMSLTAQGKTRASALSYLGWDMARAAAMTVPVLLGYGVAGLMTCLVAHSLLRLGVAWGVLLGTTRGPLWQGSLPRRQWAYAAPFGAAVALNILQGNAHQYAVSGVVSPEEFSLYAVGCFQLPFVDLLYTPTSEVLMVRLGELEKQGRLEQGLGLFHKATAALSFTFFPLAAFLLCYAPELIQVLFGERFTGAAPLLRIGLSGTVLAVLPLDGMLRGRGLTRPIFLAQVVKVCATVPLLWLGIGTWGMLGAMAAWAMTEALGKLVLLWHIPAALSVPARPLRLGQVLPWRQMGLALLAAAGAALVPLLVQVLAPDMVAAAPGGLLTRLLPLAAAAAAFATAYLLMLWLVGVRPSHLLAALGRQ